MLSTQAVEDALGDLAATSSGTLAQDMIPDLFEGTNWWYEFTDRIVDKLALTDDSRLNDYKTILHQLIDESEVLDLKTYGNPIQYATALFRRAALGKSSTVQLVT